MSPRPPSPSDCLGGAAPAGGQREQTVAEEIFNSMTCGIGLALSIAALVVLVMRAGFTGDAWRIVSVSIYGVSLMLLFLFSTLFHSIPSKKAKGVFEILDHCAIYLFIAGTYTPFMLVTIRGPWGWSVLGVVWALALLGIVFKVLFIKRFRVVSAIAYLLMGWLILVAVGPLAQRLPAAGINWLLAGGILYSVGLLFYAWQRLLFHHTVWHLFVLMGCVCHFFAVLLYV